MKLTKQWMALAMLIAMLIATSAAPLWAAPAESQTASQPASQSAGLFDKGNSHATKPASDDWPKIIGGLALVAGLIFLARHLLRRAGGATALGGRGGIVEVLHRTTLSMKHQLLVVKFGRRLLLMQSSPQGLRTLSELSDPDEIAEMLTAIERKKPGSFTTLMDRKAGQFAGDAKEVAPSAANKPPASTDEPGEALRQLGRKLRRQEDQLP